MSTATIRRPRWGDEAEEDDLDARHDFNDYETPVDSNGIKQRVTFTTNSSGKRVKRVELVRVVEKARKLPKAVVKRMNMRKFGECANLPPGLEDGITAFGDPISVIPTHQKKMTAEETAQQLTEESFSMNIVCRVCGKSGEHWTSKCPYKDKFTEEQSAQLLLEADTGAGPDGAPGGGAAGAGGSSGKYVAPGMRAGGGGTGSEMRRERDDSTTVRVSNLSEEAREQDLRELFSPFGHISRIYLAKDRHTGASRGFAFVNYIHRDDCEKAIAALNGRGYGHLILNVSFSQPREDSAGGRRRF